MENELNTLQVSQQVFSQTDLSKRQFDILNPTDYLRAMEELSKNKNLFELMWTGFQLKYDITRGLHPDELEELLKSEQEPSKQFMLKEIENLSEGQLTCLATTLPDLDKRDSILMVGKMSNGKYDILNVQATQVKHVDEQKIIALGVGAVCAGLIVGAIGTPIAGVITGGSLLAASAAKATYDHRKVLPDLIYGYVFKTLTERKVIDINNDAFMI